MFFLEKMDLMRRLQKDFGFRRAIYRKKTDSYAN